MISQTLISEPPAPTPYVDPVTSAEEADSEQRAEEQTSEAFVAAPFVWRESQLAPFAIDREGDWLIHRKLIGAPPLSEIIEDAPAMLADAVRVLWFCSHGPREWRSVVARHDASAEESRHTRAARMVEEKIVAWAADHIAGDEMADVVSLFYRIYNRAHSTRAVATGGGGKREKK